METSTPGTDPRFEKMVETRRRNRSIVPGSEATGSECVPGVAPDWLTRDELKHLYGTDYGMLSVNRARIRRNGTDGKAHVMLCHADVLRLYREGTAEQPRQKKGRDKRVVQRWRERLSRSVDMLTRGEALQAGELADPPPAPVDPEPVSRNSSGVVPRPDSGWSDAHRNGYDREAAEQRGRELMQQAQQHLEPGGVATPEWANLVANEVRVLAGMVSVVADERLRAVLTEQVDRVLSALGGEG